MTVVFSILILTFVILIFTKISKVESRLDTLAREVKRQRDGLAPQEPTAAPILAEEPEPAPDLATAPLVREVPLPAPPEPEMVVKSAPLSPSPAPKPASKVVRPKREFNAANFLGRVGIVTLVLGVAFFVKYAFDRGWIGHLGPIGRVAVGLLAGGAVIAVAHRLRRKYHLFASLLTGGGIAILYITITLALRQYHLFGPVTALILLAAVTALSVALALRYDHRELALFSLLGGLASPLMADMWDTASYPILFGFLLILGSGMLAVAQRRRWPIISWVIFAATQLFLWVWLASHRIEVAQQAGLLAFVGLFFVQFYLLALLDHRRTGQQLRPLQAFLILGNNLLSLLAAITIMGRSPLHADGAIALMLALANAIVLVQMLREGGYERRLVHLVIAMVAGLVTLAIPLQLDGNAITLCWAAEAAVLLWLWRRTGIGVFNGAFAATLLLALFSYTGDIEDAFTFLYSYEADSWLRPELPILANRLFITGLTIIASLGVSKWLLSRPVDELKGILPGRTLRPIVTGLLIGMGYLVPRLEICHQLQGTLCAASASYYTMLYIAALAIVYRRFVGKRAWALCIFVASTCLYATWVVPQTAAWRSDLFGSTYLIEQPLFLLHYIALGAFACIVCLVARRLKTLPHRAFEVCAWVTAAAVVAALTAELDNSYALLAGKVASANLHRVGYPILWGVLASILMVWGLRNEQVVLRRISLTFFALIIAKFYLSDVWGMSQAGRIVAFVVLGLILLSISFTMQRLRMLMSRRDEEPPNP